MKYRHKCMFFAMKRTLPLLISVFLLPTLALAATPSVPVSEAQKKAAFDQAVSALKSGDMKYFTTVSAPTGPAGTVNCFDYYHFQSVQVNVTPTASSTPAGSPVTFTGTLENQNSYPIVDGQIYVKIFRDNPDQTAALLNANDLIDQYVLKSSISLAAHGKTPLSFTWTPPLNLQAGGYKAAFYFETSQRFNLLGLSFEDDVTGNTTSFNIGNNPSVKNVMFDKSSVTMNGQPFYFAQPPLSFGTTTAVKISAKLVNPTSDSLPVTVTWQDYNWDGLRAKSLVDATTSSVTLAPHTSTVVSYTETKNPGVVSYVVATATAQGVASILDTRFGRDGREEARLALPGITSYPLTQGQGNTLFACFHAISPSMSDATVSAVLKDSSGNIIASTTYAGVIPGDMTAIAYAFTPAQSYTDFSLIETLSQGGTIIDQVTQKYSCADIDPSLCVEKTSATGLDVADLIGGGIILLLLISGLGTYVFLKRKRSVLSAEPTSSL